METRRPQQKKERCMVPPLNVIGLFKQMQLQKANTKPILNKCPRLLI